MSEGLRNERVQLDSSINLKEAFNARDYFLTTSNELGAYLAALNIVALLISRATEDSLSPGNQKMLESYLIEATKGADKFENRVRSTNGHSSDAESRELLLS